MRKRNILTAAISLSLVACLSIGATLAYFTDKSETQKNVFTSGLVDITLVDESPVNSEHTDWVVGTKGDEGISYTDVFPGTTASKKVGVNVAADSSDAYVAIRVGIDVFLPYGDALLTSMAEQDLLDKLDESMYPNWTGVVDSENECVYFYYNDPVSAGAELTLFDHIEVPAEWGNDHADMNFTIAVQAAAIQADNMSLGQFMAMDWDSLATLNR